MKKLLPKSFNNPHGFTLVELMVVISIIAILSVVGITLFSGAQATARDGERKAEIDAISKALETNYTSGSTTPYPVVVDTMFASGKIPVDPQTSAGYKGVPTAVAATFTICATLEKKSGNATSDTGADLGTTSTGAYYCKKNQQ